MTASSVLAVGFSQTRERRRSSVRHRCEEDVRRTDRPPLRAGFRRRGRPPVDGDDARRGEQPSGRRRGGCPRESRDAPSRRERARDERRRRTSGVVRRWTAGSLVSDTGKAWWQAPPAPPEECTEGSPGHGVMRAGAICFPECWSMAGSLPDGLGVGTQPRSAREGSASPVPSRVLLAVVVAVLPVLALLNVFGQRPTVSTARALPADLRVTSPARLRSGLIFQVRVEVVARRAHLDAPAHLLPGLVGESIERELAGAQPDGRDELATDAWSSPTTS